MEQASIGIAAKVLDALREIGIDQGSERVLILCGPGNNGGDGFAVARHLFQWGSSIEVRDLESRKETGGGDERSTQLDLLDALGVEVTNSSDHFSDPGPRPDLIVDAIFGSGLNRPPRGIHREAIEKTRQWQIPVLAVDIPSGLDADSGLPLEVAVEARWTVTLAIPKMGFLEAESRPYVGELTLVPIGAPRQLLPGGVPAFPPLPHRTRISDSFHFSMPAVGGQS